MGLRGGTDPTVAGFEASLTERKPPPTLLGVLITVRAAWARAGVTTTVLVPALPGLNSKGPRADTAHIIVPVRGL